MNLSTKRRLAAVTIIASLVMGGCSDDDSTPAGDSGVMDQTASMDTGADGASSCNLDGKKDPGEQCDGQDLDGKTCTDFGATGGTLICAACEFITSGCTGSTTCTSDELEPNDNETEATQITLPYNKGGLTFCGNEDDWFLMDLQGNTSYELKVTYEADPGDLYLYLMASNDLQHPVASASTQDGSLVITYDVPDYLGGGFLLLVDAITPDTLRNTPYGLSIAQKP
jgi:hypothetical protein